MFNKNKKETELIAFIMDNKASFYRFAYSYVRNQEDALDIVQDSIHKALKKQHQLKDISMMKSWFYRIVATTSLDFLRKRKRWHVTDDENLEILASSSVDTYKNLDLEQAINQLPPSYKTIVILRFFEDLKLEEIASVLGENINTVKTKLYKALKILRIEMK
ncbi:MAG: RNA polymerase sigma factor [Bacillus sp. (in: Bacteria)]|uniref:RNA polymerase sigma factor n=2 Tax=Niallia TaxID=2837506 RepID=A0A941GA92_NIACI|nr:MULTISPECIES: RNA polymerase sigma factor [Niallia]MBQ6446012.1 RNA polymerase sigma factor [Bacillus sp. (in: firmicutes)]MCB5236167.1 RNA polymerase sigma factor [Niallia circulans]MDU1846541.1 RNA polymerase sigma factor [Niallia nealsonii]NMO79136.1 RNA polymerase sigma factor [Niallia alba]